MSEAREQFNASFCLCPFTCHFFTFLYHLVVIWSPVTFHYIWWDFAARNHFLWDLPQSFPECVCVYMFYYTFETFALAGYALGVSLSLLSWNKMFGISSLLCWVRLNKVVSLKLYTFNRLEQGLFSSLLSKSVSRSRSVLCQLLLLNFAVSPQ